MGMSFAEYAALHQQEPTAEERERMEAAAADIRAAKFEREQARKREESNLKRLEEAQTEADALKMSIAKQLEQGTDPQFILYTALKCIGLLSEDPEWAEEAKAQLDAVYEDIAQQSLLNDSAIVAQQRLQQKTSKYNERLRGQLERQLSGYRKIAQDINKVLDSLGELEAE